MESKSTEMVAMSRPKDQSLDAYKAWMIDITRRLTTTESAVELTEAEWVANWKSFWKEKYKS